MPDILVVNALVKMNNAVWHILPWITSVGFGVCRQMIATGVHQWADNFTHQVDSDTAFTAFATNTGIKAKFDCMCEGGRLAGIRC